MKALFFVMIFVGSIQVASGLVAGSDLQDSVGQMAESRTAQIEQIIGE